MAVLSNDGYVERETDRVKREIAVDPSMALTGTLEAFDFAIQTYGLRDDHRISSSLSTLRQSGESRISSFTATAPEDATAHHKLPELRSLIGRQRQLEFNQANSTPLTEVVSALVDHSMPPVDRVTVAIQRLNLLLQQPHGPVPGELELRQIDRLLSELPKVFVADTMRSPA